MDQWKSLSMSHVVYPDGDPIGYILAWCSLLPLMCIVSFITLIIFKRDLLTICYFVGILINELFNCILKNFIKESRPYSNGSGYGMPSSHSQFMAFFLTFFAFLLFVRNKRNQEYLLTFWSYVSFMIAFVMTVLVLIGRVYLMYHTWSQVIVGSLIGVVNGCLWFLIVQFLLTPVFPTVVTWQLSEYLMIRDCSNIPNILQFEYQSIKTEMERRRKNN